MQEMWFQSLGWEDLLEREMSTHSSILAWEIPWTEELSGLYSPWGSQRVRHDFVIKQLQTSQPPRMRLFILHPWLGTASAARAQLILVTTAAGQGSLPRRKSLTPFVYKWGIYSYIL